MSNSSQKLQVCSKCHKLWGVVLLLGIDVGSTTIKAALVEVSPSGVLRTVAVARRATPDTAQALISETASAVREALHDRPAPLAVAVASMAETGVALGADGTALGPLVRWQRSAGRAGVRFLSERFPDLDARTGIPFSPKPTAAALRELSETDPGLLARTAHWLGVADLVVRALTGVHATDPTLATRTMLFVDGAWDEEIAEAVGLSPGALPAVRPVGEAAGTTTAAARGFGLGTGIQVFTAGHDHAVGAWAAGAREPGSFADSLGTAEAILVPTASERAGETVRDGFTSGRSVDGRWRTLMAGSPACGALLNRTFGTTRVRASDLLAALPADRWTPSGVTVLPYPRGRQSPAPDPSATLDIRTEQTDPTLIASAVLEAIVLQSRWMREAMAGYVEVAPERVVLLGSLTERIPAWGGLVAATSASPVVRVTEPEPVAIGAALLAGVHAGHVDPGATLPSEEVAPIPVDLAPAYARFREAAAATIETKETDDHP